jgi:hypothetical protein
MHLQSLYRILYAWSWGFQLLWDLCRIRFCEMFSAPNFLFVRSAHLIWSGMDYMIYGLLGLVRIVCSGTDCVIWHRLCVIWYIWCELVQSMWSGTYGVNWYRVCDLVHMVWTGTEYVTLFIFTEFSTNLLLKVLDQAFGNSGIHCNVTEFYQVARLNII